MSAGSAELGRCPRCSAQIPRTHVLIEYETAEGPSAYAECPTCRDVVHPDREEVAEEDGRGSR